MPEDEWEIKVERGAWASVGRYLIPGKVTCEYHGKDGHPDATVRLEVRNGLPEVVEIAIRSKSGGRGIRGVDLSTLQVDKLIEFAVGATGIEKGHPRLSEVVDHGDGTASVRLLPGYEKQWAVRGAVSDARTHLRAGSDLETVARLYHEHVDSGGTAPVDYIRKACGGISLRTATRRVEQARAAGLIPPSSRTRKELTK